MASRQATSQVAWLDGIGFTGVCTGARRKASRAPRAPWFDASGDGDRRFYTLPEAVSE